MFKEDILKGKKILVTGGGTGLGKEMSEHYVKHGADVVICGRRESVLADTANEFKDKYGANVRYQPLDIRSPQDVEDFVDSIFQEGPLHGLVNNAAGNFISPTKDLSARGFDAIANIVFHGTFYVTNAVGKRWLEQKIKGSIISILATWVWTGSPFVVPSAAAKAGVLAMTRSLAVEWGKYNIRFNAIAPGPFPTKGAWSRLMPPGFDDFEDDMKNKIPMKRFGERHELENLASYLMSDGSAYINGEVVTIDGGEWIAGAGEFSDLTKLPESMWKAMAESRKKK